MEDNYKNNVQINQFEAPKRFSFKNNDKTQDNEINIIQNRYEKTQGNEINIIQNRYEVLSDSYGNDTIGWNNDNDKLSNNVTTSASPRQVNLGNNDIRKDQQKHKSKTKKRN